MLEVATKVGRAIKFTPERIEQIRNLVERGTSREQIAEIVGCTVGSLQVTCSRLGISLRRPRVDNGVGMRPMPHREVELKRPTLVYAAGNGNGGTVPAVPSNQQFELRLQYKGRSILLPFDATTMTALIMEAEVRGMRVSELLAKIMRTIVDQNLVAEILAKAKEAT